ncbi:CD81 antigen-like protein [Lates japonicus]|uniref:CD81 antigen-like protein n=1 Tax=Lates japonicus TaxID=270547 RepID=A0AAD3MSE3_LATJO|nr:CD81 antigen-like protein [Lates japonicus]
MLVGSRMLRVPFRNLSVSWGRGSGCSNLGFHEQGHSNLLSLFVVVSLKQPARLSPLSTDFKELINFYDFMHIKAVDALGLPARCRYQGPGCLATRSQSCHDKLIELFSEKLHLIGLAALVIGIIMVFEMIFTMVLCCGIRNSPGVY